MTEWYLLDFAKTDQLLIAIVPILEPLAENASEADDVIVTGAL